ncbi:MAG: uL15 family ribosomal protein [Nanoarchaeota archaeon]
MVVKRAKKSKKFHGTRRHGYGFSKQHQGKGHRGGKGNAGLGKRGQQRATLLYSKHIKHLGRIGAMVERRGRTHEEAITLRDIDLRVEGWASKNLVKKEKDVFTIDIEALGYDKVVSSGKINHKIKVIGAVSAEAKKKIEAAGGSAAQ